MTTLLFFDDHRLSRRDNVARRVGRPRRIPESVYRDPHANTAWGYPSVFFDPGSGKWRMCYLGWTREANVRVPLLAESDDGLHWQPRDTTRDIDLPDRKTPNQLLPLDEFGEWPACYIDERAEPQERIKGLVVFHPSRNFVKTRLWTSPDGLHWTLKEGVQWQEQGPDPGVAVYWNEVRQSYCFTTRPDWTDRRIAVFETRDWRTFTTPELCMQADALDSRLAEIYGMPVFPYEGYFVALPWIFHVDPSVPGHSPHKFHDGHVDCQLAYSLNGWHFQRGLRDPFIPNGEPGEPDAGCVYPSCMVRKDKGDLWIYASACTLEHGYNPYGSGSILAYRLRRDGFVYLESTGGVGVVGTRAVYWQGGELELNVQAQGGHVRAQVTDIAGEPLDGFSFDDCVPFSGDDTAWAPTWQDGRRLAAHANSLLRIEVELKSARLYAIRGDFVHALGGQCWRLRDDGLKPEPRPGF